MRKYIEQGIEAPTYGPRSVGRPSKLARYLDFLSERVAAFPDLSAARLTREIRELGYTGAYTAVKRYLAAIRPDNQPRPYEVRFETPPHSVVALKYSGEHLGLVADWQLFNSDVRAERSELSICLVKYILIAQPKIQVYLSTMDLKGPAAQQLKRAQV